MKNKNIRFFCSAAVFLTILALILSSMQHVLARKELEKPLDMSRKVAGFYNEPEDEFAVMFFGSSHVYTAFSPLELWEETGVKSYVFSSQQQPPWATYTYIQEALKTQSPELIVVECHMILDDQVYYADAVTYSHNDHLPLTWNKVELAWRSAPDLEGKLGLVCNFLKYHSRWSELKAEDFDYDPRQLRDPYKGFVMLDPKPESPWWGQPDISGITWSAPLEEKHRYWLEEIIKLCQEAGVELWLVKTPSNLPEDRKALLNAVEELAGQYGVPVFDFNGAEAYAAIGIDQNYFFDRFHLDALGGTKFTRYFARLLLERCPNLSREPEDTAWAADLAAYRAAMDQYQWPDTP